MSEIIEENGDCEDSPAMKKAKIIKHQLDKEISIKNGYSNDQLMPLNDRLKIITDRISKNDFEVQVNSFWSNSRNEGEDDLDIQTKLSNLINLIHIESAMTVGINNALEIAIKDKESETFSRNVHQERLMSSEKKKLLVVILKHVLFEYNKGDDRSDVSLESDLMNLIKVNCEHCNKSTKNNAIDQYCTCKVYNPKRDSIISVPIVLNVSVLNFMGHYTYQDIDNIFNGTSRPCNNRDILNDECQCLGRHNMQTIMESQFKRMVTLTVDNTLMASSEWSKSKVKGLYNKEMKVLNGRQLEIQVWEKKKIKGMKKAALHLIAMVILPLKCFTCYNNKKTLTFNMEPAGVISLEFELMSKINMPQSKHKIVRRFSIFRKINQFKRCMFSKPDLFKNKISNIKPQEVNGHQDKDHSHYHGEEVNGRQDKDHSHYHGEEVYGHQDKDILQHNTEKETSLCTRTKKVDITPVSSKNKVYTLTDDNRLMVTTKVKIRAPCPFVRPCKEALFECQQKKVVAAYLSTTCDESLSLIYSKGRDSVNIQGTVSPLQTKYATITTSTPNKKSKLPENIRSYNNRDKEFCLRRSGVTRSDVNLSIIEDVEDLAERINSDDEETKNKLTFDEPDDHNPNHIRIQTTIVMDEAVELCPEPCSPEVMKIKMFVIDSGRRSTLRTQEASLRTSRTDSKQFYSSYLNQSLGDSSVNGLKEHPDHVNTPYEASEISEDNESVDEKDSKLTYHKLELLSVLGQGNFGKVLLAKYKGFSIKNGLCAIKVISKKMIQSTESHDTVMSERSILMLINEAKNPFLVGLIGCLQTENYLIFAIEYACGGDLMGHIHRGPFQEDNARFYSACVLLALDFLHSNNIMYRDIKLENLVMDAQGYVKLTDFGLSKMGMAWDTMTGTFCGTPEFLAPEIINNKPYTRVADWWAFGVLLYEMILGEVPFEGESSDEIFANALKGYITSRILSSEAYAIIKRLLQRNVRNRLGYGEDGTEKVMKQAYYRKTDWEAMKARTVPAPLLPELINACDTQYFEDEFTAMELTINQDDESVDNIYLDQDMFKDFDTDVIWDKFL